MASTFATSSSPHPGASRAGVAMFIEKHRNSLVLGVVVVLSVVLLAVLFSPGAESSPTPSTPSTSDASEASEIATEQDQEEKQDPFAATMALLSISKVIPDVVDDFTPKADITLNIGSRALQNGQHLPLNEAQESPSLTARSSPNSAPPSGKFVLVTVDPDAPSPDDPSARSWLHWIVRDVEDGAIVTPGSGTGKEVVEYNKPTPPRGTHRYVSVVYHQPEDLGEVSGPEGRAKFNLREFAKEYNLGDPAAVFYFTTAPQERR